MKSGKALILFSVSALIALLVLQGVWLFYAFENSKKQLADDSKKALSEGIEKLEEKLHVNQLMAEIPDLKHLDTLIEKETSAAVNVVISNGKKL
ncbi:MAG: hypothetical protein AB7O73_07560, partial [Bacteroidia bacterium]